MGKAYSSRQRTGGQYSGRVEQNTTQSKERWSDLSASDQAKLMKTTGQASDPQAIARTRHFHGQAGPPPSSPPAPRYQG